MTSTIDTARLQPDTIRMLPEQELTRPPGSPCRPPLGLSPAYAERDGSLVIRVAGMPYSLPIRAVVDVVPPETVRKASWAPPWFRGVVRTPGGRALVLDLGAMLRLGTGTAAPASYVVIAEVEVRGHTVPVGLLADDEARVVPRHAAAGTVVLDAADLLSADDVRAAEWLTRA